MSFMSVEFVDTNVIVYAHDPAAVRKSPVARQLLERLWDSNSGVVSIQVLQELYVVLTRKGQSPLTPRRTIEIVEGLAAWTTHRPTAGDIVAAARLSTRHQLSFWDAMVVRSALQTGAEILWTEDLQHGQKIESVEIRNPFV